MNGPAFKSAETATGLPWARLVDHLDSRGLRMDPDPPPRQFAAGMGNLNYRITIDGTPAVLRRPPLGPIPPGANDMGREHKVLSRLHEQFPLAPRSFYFCDDDDVIGAPFQIIEFREGAALSGATLPAHLAGDPDHGRALCETMIRVLADLHAVDPAAVGLDDLGRPDGFLDRAIAGWSKRAAIALDDTPAPAVDEVGDWLRARTPSSGSPTLLHNDFKLDNMLLALDADGRIDPAIRPTAVLDWDQATRGDPLFDLATLISYWTDPGDPEAMRDLAQMPTAAPGMLSRDEAVALYGAITGCDVSDFLFYRVLAMFKLAVVFLQLYAQYRRGTVTDPRYAPFERIGLGIAAFALDETRGRAP